MMHGPINIRYIVKCTVRVEDFPAHTMKAYKGSRGIAPLIPNFGSRWR